MIIAAVLAIVIGALMIALWLGLYFSGQIPELKTERFRILFHIAGELVTACVLISGGVGLLRQQPWGNWVHLLGLGMLLYTAIVSPGYYAQRKQWPMVGMFTFIIMLVMISILIVT